jgi:hypothetical protein
MANETYQERSSAFKFETLNDGTVLGPDGCSHADEAEAMFYSLKCTCGCGNPRKIHRFIIECLKCFDYDGTKAGLSSMTQVRGIKALIQDDPDIAAEFIGHVLDGECLVEHGGSIFGGWTTGRGKQFIEIGPHDETWEA